MLLPKTDVFLKLKVATQLFFDETYGKTQLKKNDNF